MNESDDWKLSLIDKDLLYRVLSIPTCSEHEIRMQEFLLEYSRQEGYQATKDEKGNIYLSKGELSNGQYFPCVVAHMDTVQSHHLPFIRKNRSIQLKTEELDGEHIIYAEGFGLGGDDKAGIVIALTIMKIMPMCKAAFFVEEEIGCVGSLNADLAWFHDVGYIIAFDAPGGNCASWSCNGERLFDVQFYENYLVELGEKFGLTNYKSHPYTDVMILRKDTSLACVNFGAGYHNYHTLHEYVVAEEMDKAASMGVYLIESLGLEEYVLPFTPHSKDPNDPDYSYFKKKFT